MVVKATGQRCLSCDSEDVGALITTPDYVSGELLESYRLMRLTRCKDCADELVLGMIPRTKAKTDLSCSSGGGSRIIRDGKEMS